MIAPNFPTSTSIAVVQDGTSGVVTAQVTIQHTDPARVLDACYRCLIAAGHDPGSLTDAMLELLHQEGVIESTDSDEVQAEGEEAG